MTAKLIELVCESLPQLIVQFGGLLGVVLINTSGNSIDLLPLFSITFSVLAVGFVLTDLSIEIERDQMNRNIRGPYSNPNKGALPERYGGLFAFGHFIFSSGYFACAVIAYTVAGRAFPGYYIAIYMLVEWAAFLLLMRVTGRARFLGGIKKGVGLLDILRPDWGTTSILPILASRQDELIGGAIFSRFIVYKLVLTTAVVYVGSNEIDADVLMVIHGVALVLAVVGIVLMLIFASDTHRWTLYKTKISTKQHFQSYFKNDNEPLVFTFTTYDEAKLNEFVTVHPYYFVEVQKKVKQWILGLKVTDELFRSGVVPKGVDILKGQSFDTVFKKLKYKFEYFNDMEGSELIDEHLDALLLEVAAIKNKLKHDKESMQLKKSEEKTSTTTSPKQPNPQNLLMEAIADKVAAIKEKDAALIAIASLRTENKKLRKELSER